MNPILRISSCECSRNHCVRERRHAGFTLVELLVLIGTVGLLAAMLLPALAGTRSDGRAFQCLNNTKRLTAAWLMYAGDNSDRLMPASKWVGNNAFLDWTGGPGNTNTAILLDPGQSLIALYIKSASVFKCPADIYQSPANQGPRDRSYSLSAGVGGAGLNPEPAGSQYPAGRSYPTAGAVKMTQLNAPGPAKTWAFLDEHPDSINDGVFQFNAGHPPSAYEWRDLPASYHKGAGGFSFADGRADIHCWLEWGRRGSIGNVLPTIRPVTYLDWPTTSCPRSQDYAWMNEGMPYNYSAK